MTRLLCLFIAAMLLVSCASAPPSAAGLYGPEPVAQDISGSNAQSIVSRTVNYTSEEIFEATKTAMLRLGYIVDEQNQSKGKITGSGTHNCGAVTMAIYIKQTSPEPSSTYTVIADRHEWYCWLGGEFTIANGLATEIQKVLATF